MRPRRFVRLSDLNSIGSARIFSFWEPTTKQAYHIREEHNPRDFPADVAYVASAFGRLDFYTKHRTLLEAQQAILADLPPLVQLALSVDPEFEKFNIKKNPTGPKTFTPSYLAQSKPEYEKKVAEGHKRDLHIMVDGGRRSMRGPTARRPDAEEIPVVKPATWARFKEKDPPWDARTQDPRSWEAATGRRQARTRVVENSEQQIVQALSRYRTTLGDAGTDGFIVPDTPWPLIEAGLSPKIAQILVDRSANVFFRALPESSIREIKRPDLQTAVVSALRGFLFVRQDGKLVLPVPGKRQEAELRRIDIVRQLGQKPKTVLTASEIEHAYAKYKENTKAETGRSYRREVSDPLFMKKIYAALTAEVRATPVTDTSVMVFTFSFREKQFARFLPLREHSKLKAPQAPRPALGYKTLKNVQFADLPALLARLGQRKKRRGRRLSKI